MNDYEIYKEFLIAKDSYGMYQIYEKNDADVFDMQIPLINRYCVSLGECETIEAAKAEVDSFRL